MTAAQLEESIMTIRNGYVVAVIAFLAVCYSAGPASAQVPSQVPPIITGFPPSQNVGAAIGARAPGRMVQAGIGRAQNAVTLPRPVYNITETLPPISRRTAFLVTAIQSSFVALNSALAFFEDLLFRRAGLSVPSTGDTTSDDTGGNTAGDTTAHLRF